MSNALSNSEEQYTPGSEWYAPAYKFKDQYTNLDATVLNEILKSIYDKTNYLKNNLESFKEDMINQAVKVGLTAFVAMDGIVTTYSTTQISGSSTYFLRDLVPGNQIRIQKDVDTYLYYSVKSIESQTSLTINESIGASDSFSGIQFSLFEVNKDYETIDSGITSDLDPSESLVGNIELIGDYVKSIDDKLTEVIDGLGFDPTTGQGSFNNLTLNELMAEINADIASISDVISNITTGLGFNSNGELGQYYSTYYVSSSTTVQDAISALDGAINNLSFADAATLNNLIVTCGAKTDGSHTGYPASRRYIKDGNPSYYDTLIDMDSKMNLFPGMYDVILDPSQTAIKHPTNICTTMTELVAYINTNGPDLNVFIANTGTYINVVTDNALILHINKLSGCTFYGEQTELNQSFVIDKSGPTAVTAAFTAVKFYNFVFKMAEVRTADLLYDIFTLAEVGINQTGTLETEQLIKFIDCKFIPFYLTVPIDVSDRAFISINSSVLALPTAAAVTDTTIELNNCHTTGYVFNVLVTDKDFVAPFIRHVSNDTTDARIKIKIINCDLFGHWSVTAGGASPDLTYVKEITVKDSYLRDHFYIFNFDNYGPVAEFSNSKFEQLYGVAGHESADKFMNLEIGAAALALEFHELSITDCFFRHRNVIDIEAYKIYEYGSSYYSKRASAVIGGAAAMVLHTARMHKKNNNRYYYSPGTLMNHYLEVKAYADYVEDLSIANLSFNNMDDSDFAVTATGYTLYINENGQTKFGTVKDIDIYHNVGAGFGPLYNATGSGEKLLVERISYSMAKANTPMQGTGAAWNEDVNQNFVYIGQGSAYAANLYNFSTNKLLDLGEFSAVPNVLTILSTGLYRLTITNVDSTVIAGLTTATLAIGANAPFTNYATHLFPIGRMLTALGGGVVIADQRVDGETFDSVYELQEGATITVSTIPNSELRIVLERIK